MKNLRMRLNDFHKIERLLTIQNMQPRRRQINLDIQYVLTRTFDNFNYELIMEVDNGK